MLISFKDSQEATKNQKEYEAGRYQVKVVKATDGKAATGTPYIEVEFETIGETVFKVRNRFYSSQKSLSILLNFLGAVGVYDKNSKDDLNFENEDLLGSILSVEFVKGEPNEQGKSYLEYNPWSAEAVSGLATPKKAAKTTDDLEEAPF